MYTNIIYPHMLDILPGRVCHIDDLASVWQRSGDWCDKDRGIGARRNPAACLFHKSGLTHHASSEGKCEGQCYLLCLVTLIVPIPFCCWLSPLS